MADERRKHPRTDMRVEAEVRFTSWTVYALIYTINISKGGMNLELSEEPQPDAKLTIRLTQPDGMPLLLDAVVRHVAAGKKGWSVGVEFESLDDATRVAIEKKIRAHGVPLQVSGLKPRQK
jgi:PilZ domain-containing protein